jgi:serine O-acetyltransferase
MLSDLRKDLARYSESGKGSLLEPSIVTIVSYRLGQWSRRCTIPFLGPIVRSMHLVLHAVVTIAIGIYLPRGASIGPGLRIFHFGGIVVSPSAVIGRNCTLRNNVCIGSRYSSDDAPTIGDNVEFGVGSVVIGRIRVGNNSRIGANAVVLADVPDDTSAVGVPARLVPRLSHASSRT